MPIKKIFLTGVGCIGKTTIGTKLATLLGCQFFDLDGEIEKFFRTSIERLQMRYPFPHSFRKEASRVLKHLLSQNDSDPCVIALPPSGLMGDYWKVVKMTKAVIVVILDNPENILKRIAFFDINSRPIDKSLTTHKKCLYLRKIKEDITYFRRSYLRATLSVDIAGLNPECAAYKVKADLTQSKFWEG